MQEFSQIFWDTIVEKKLSVQKFYAQYGTNGLQSKESE